MFLIRVSNSSKKSKQLHRKQRNAINIPATADGDPLATCVVVPESAAAAATGSSRPAILLSPPAAAATTGLAATSLTTPGPPRPAATQGLLLGAPWRRGHWMSTPATAPENGRGGALASMAGMDAGSLSGGVWRSPSKAKNTLTHARTHARSGLVCQRVRSSLCERCYL